MGCRLSAFTVGQWESTTLAGHVVEAAPAQTKSLKLDGVVYKVDGKFNGFTGSKDAALYHAGRELRDAEGNQPDSPEIHS